MLKKTTTKKNKNQKKSFNPIHIYCVALVIIFSVVFSHVFDPKLDLNGDNANYYIYATALANGDGYVDLATKDHRPTNNFPPGYPALMSMVMLFTKSVTAQKILNGVFLIASILILFIIMQDLLQNRFLSFALSTTLIFNAHLLKFATMMMSEMSFLLISCATLYQLIRIDYKIALYKNARFYIMMLLISYGFYIRTQGITLLAAVIVYFLFSKRWQYVLITITGFSILYFPWIIRNRIVGIGGNKYLSKVLAANHWNPEAGSLSFIELVIRFVKTQIMLITKAIPDSIFNFYTPDYQITTGLQWLIGLLVLSIIIYAIIRVGSYQFFFLGYLLATMGIIGLWSAPSGNRYLVCLTPFLQIQFFYGIFSVGSVLLSKYTKFKSINPAWIYIIVISMLPGVSKLAASAKRSYPPAYNNYFQIALDSRQYTNGKSVVCCRKVAFFYLFGQTPAYRYPYTSDEKQFIQALLHNDVEFVVLDQLGYSSTYKYLYPVIKNHPQLFTPLDAKKNPDTYFLQFNRKLAHDFLLETRIN